jgi:heme exporter protein D
MAMYVWFVGATITVASLLLTLWVRRVRPHRPLSRDQQMRAGRAAVRALRKESSRSKRPTYCSGRGMGYRHSGAILENSVYGDAANWGDGGSGGGDSF